MRCKSGNSRIVRIDKVEPLLLISGKVIVDSIRGLPGVLKEAKQIPSTSPYHKVYEKRGGFRQAETDFETLKPPTARDFIWVCIGTRRIISLMTLFIMRSVIFLSFTNVRSWSCRIN